MAVQLGVGFTVIVALIFGFLAVRELGRNSPRRVFRVLIYGIIGAAMLALGVGLRWEPGLYAAAFLFTGVVLALAADGIRSGQERRYARATEGERLRRHVLHRSGERREIEH